MEHGRRRRPLLDLDRQPHHPHHPRHRLRHHHHHERHPHPPHHQPRRRHHPHLHHDHALPTAPVGATSPTCGHTYTWPSRTKTNPQGTYRITATAHWNVHWTALGYTGTIPVTTTDTRDLPVTELHALARIP